MQSTSIALAALALSSFAASLAHADTASTTLQLDLPAAYAANADDAAAAAPSSAGTASAVRWGEKGCVTVNAFAGYANDFEETSIVPAAIGISWFPIKNFSFDIQLEGAYVDQPGDSATGGGAAMMIRWHFLDFDTWTLYGDLGIGCLFMSDSVPSNAADFVFTPRAGLGASIEITEATRLMVGARWFHISNAETSFENPGINALQGYVGLSFAF
jgi:hypothetical protein